MFDFSALVLDPLYEQFGVAVAVTPKGATAPLSPIVVIDMTQGLDVSLAGAVVSSIEPAIMMRVADLTSRGKAAADLRGATLNLAGKNWRIDNFRPKPSPQGEAAGEVAFTLVQL